MQNCFDVNYFTSKRARLDAIFTLKNRTCANGSRQLGREDFES